jgi:hypothetical protein
MHKLIDDLIAHATYVSEPDDPDYRHESFDKKKFAELIIRECADLCDMLLNDKMGSEWARGTHDCAKAIREHFGVE